MSPDDSRDGARDLVREHLLRMPGYEPVEPIDVVAKQLGIPEGQIVKLDANENPYGPSPKVREALERYEMYHIYPDPAQSRVREAVADYVGVEPEEVVLGNGSDDLLDLCAGSFCRQVIRWSTSRRLSASMISSAVSTMRILLKWRVARTSRSILSEPKPHFLVPSWRSWRRPIILRATRFRSKRLSDYCHKVR